MIVKIKTEDICNDMIEMKDVFDFSDNPKDHPLYDNSNKTVKGVMKDDRNSVTTSTFARLRSKLYALLRSD